MKTLSVNQLEEVLRNANNSIASFANVIQLTQPKTLKKDRQTKLPFNGKIEKLTTLKVLLNTSYENGILNQLTRENKEETEYKKGVNTMPIDKSNSNNNFFGYFKNQGVIEYRPFDNSKPKTTYLLDDMEVDKNTLPDVLPTTSKATNQGTDKEILWRKLYVKNIVAITINKVTYINEELKDYLTNQNELLEIA